MAWLFKNDWVANPRPPTAADLDKIGADMRTWGGSVDAGSYNLSNLGVLTFRAGGYLSSPLAFGSMGYLNINVTGDQPTIQTYGGKALAINPAGNNVGIGTASPSAKLHIQADANNGIRLTSVTGPGTLSAVVFNTEDNRLTVGTVSNHPTVFFTNNAERVRIAEGGNVGIGTANPSDKLVVAAIPYGAGQNGGIVISDTAATPYLKASLRLKLDGLGVARIALGWDAAQASAAIEALTINYSGNVGIGTASPKYHSHVSGAGQVTAALTDAGGKGGSLFLSDTNGAGNAGGALLLGGYVVNGDFPQAAIKSLMQSTAGNGIADLAILLRAATGDVALTERVRITAAGNVGIGTANPEARLDLGGSSGVPKLYLYNDGSSVVGFGVYANECRSFVDLTTTVITWGQQTHAGAFTEWMRLKNGSLGIGTASPKQALHVAGQGWFPASTPTYDPGDGSGAGLRIGYSTGDFGYINASDTGVAGKSLILQPAGGWLISIMPPNAVADGGVLMNSMGSFYLDEVGKNVMVKIKTSGGVFKTVVLGTWT